MSEEDVIQIDDSDEETEPKPKEKLERKLLFDEEDCTKLPKDEIEPDDLPIGTYFFYF